MSDEELFVRIENRVKILCAALQQCINAADSAVTQLNDQDIACPAQIGLAAEQARLALRIVNGKDDLNRWLERLKILGVD